jgi:hypothetical protein
MMAIENPLELDICAIGDPQGVVLRIYLLPDGSPGINGRLSLAREHIPYGPEEDEWLPFIAQESRAGRVIVDEVTQGVYDVSLAVEKGGAGLEIHGAAETALARNL